MSEQAPVSLLPKREIEEISAWRPTDLARPSPRRQKAAREHLPTARELDAMREAARREGFEQGLAEGRRKGAEQIRRELQSARDAEQRHLAEIFEALNAPLAQLDRRIEWEVLALVIAMARQVIRRELRTSPHEVIGAVRAALGQLPVGARDVRVELHPDDARLVRESLQETQEDARWRILEDPMLQRGGCRVKTDDSLVDATLESRLGAMVSQLLGDDRTEPAAVTAPRGESPT